MKKNKLFDESYEKEQIQQRILFFRSFLDLPDQAHVNALLEILKCFMATNIVLKRIIADIVGSYLENN